jgi:prepilin-type N-terminal cleavage/methylation domain-containing protein/prepilin-type processing-associated H-X9-DG protein
MNRRRAFTLIELLVVIAIISLLVSILLPSLQRAWDLAKKVVCATNLRSIDFVFRLYAEDNDGWAPFSYVRPSDNRPDSNWTVFFESYLDLPGGRVYATDPAGTIFACPSFGRFGINIDLTAPRYFEINYWVRGWAHRVDDVPDPSLILRLGDSVDWHVGYILCAPPSSGGLWYLFDKHLGGANFLFFDGQVNWFPSMMWAWSVSGNRPYVRY